MPKAGWKKGPDGEFHPPSLPGVSMEANDLNAPTPDTDVDPVSDEVQETIRFRAELADRARAQAEADAKDDTYGQASSEARRAIHLEHKDADTISDDFSARLRNLEKQVEERGLMPELPKEKPTRLAGEAVRAQIVEKLLTEEEANRKERARRATMDPRAFSSDELPPVSASLYNFREDVSRYRNLDGSKPWDDGELPQWVNIRDEQSGRETTRYVDRALATGSRLVKDETGHEIYRSDCVLMKVGAEASARRVAAGRLHATKLGKLGAAERDAQERERSAQRGFHSGGLYLKENDTSRSPFSVADGEVALA